MQLERLAERTVAVHPHATHWRAVPPPLRAVELEVRTDFISRLHHGVDKPELRIKRRLDLRRLLPGQQRAQGLLLIVTSGGWGSGEEKLDELPMQL